MSETDAKMIDITESAQGYLQELLAKQEDDNVGVRRDVHCLLSSR